MVNLILWARLLKKRLFKVKPERVLSCGRDRRERGKAQLLAWTTLAPADRIGISSTGSRFVRKEVRKLNKIKAFNRLSRCLKGKTEGTILFHPMTRGIAELEDPSLLKREYRGEGNPTFELSLKLLLRCPALVSEGQVVPVSSSVRKVVVETKPF